MTTTPTSYLGRLFKKEHLVTFAKYCPLVTAILAPLSTLMDIPALTQRWYNLDGVPQPDPTASLILSAVGLALNIAANILLVLRFSSRSSKWVKHTVHWSLACWLAKTVVALVNLIVFGSTHSRAGEGGFEFAEGFWCAVVSICVAGLISIALLLHFLLAFDKPEQDTIAVRLSGRKFMLSVTGFISIIALQALVFSRLEHWSYADGIYFSIQTALTIGYGDLTPTNTASKVLIFPFAILTISQLGNEISLIVAFIKERSKERRRVWRKQYEGAIHREARMLKPHATLLEEMRLVHDINKREQWQVTSQMIDLFWSAVALLTFWLLGALVFSAIEGWTYGRVHHRGGGRFGDYTPVTAAGRVFFIPFALLAVPIVTSFAVQTITGLLSTFSNRGHTIEELRVMREHNPDFCRPHADLLDDHRRTYNELGADDPDSPAGQAAYPQPSSYEVDQTDQAKPITHVTSSETQAELLRQLMESVTRLEDQARRLLLDHLDHDLARTLLVADRNLQDPNAQAAGDPADPASSTEAIMAGVEAYRNTFAEVLVLGSRVQGLEGCEQAKFERRTSPEIPPSPLTRTVTEKADDSDTNRVDDEHGWTFAEGLHGLSRIMYRQHAKQLKRAYSVA